MFGGRFSGQSKLNPVQRARQEAMDAKREYNIKRREENYQAKQQEATRARMRKKEAEAQKKVDQKRAHQKQQEHQLNQGLQKKNVDLENEYRERNREVEILKREEKWSQRMQLYIQDLLDSSQMEADEEERTKEDAKAKRLIGFKQKTKARYEKQLADEEMNETRAIEIDKMKKKREARELGRIERLKEEMEEELDYRRDCIEQNLPITITKNDLVASLTKVPSVSELFCAVKSESDEIRYLKICDLEALAKLHGLPPLLFVKQLNADHEKTKYPIPSAIPLNAGH